MIRVDNLPSVQSVNEAVFFAFDDYSLPFLQNLRLHLVGGKKPGTDNPIVLPKGRPGAPDSASVRYYGTVLQVDDSLHMWYFALGDLDVERNKAPLSGSEPTAMGQGRLCYATSRDGVLWEKPELGIVEYNGSKANNLVHFLPNHGLGAAPIIYDLDDPNPHRRFKLAFESEKYCNKLAVAFSPDGLHWTEHPDNPVGPMLEQAGLIRFGDCYYVSGQGGRHFPRTRKLVTMASYDFLHWTQASALGFNRSPPAERGWNQGEEVHLGAGLWNRGNVIVGIYGQWHGHSSSDRRNVGIDLGLVISHDALHYREPIPDFRIVPAYEEIGNPIGAEPALNQGQGMVNVGDKTLFWYELWGFGEVRMASWERDRLGYLQSMGGPAHLISCPFRVDDPTTLMLNIDGVSEYAELSVELLDERFQPLEGFAGESAVQVKRNGLRQPVEWTGGSRLGALSQPLRLRVNMGGVRPEDLLFYAAYVETND